MTNFFKKIMQQHSARHSISIVVAENINFLFVSNCRENTLNCFFHPLHQKRVVGMLIVVGIEKLCSTTCISNSTVVEQVPQQLRIFREYALNVVREYPELLSHLLYHRGV